jgi:hypothetical protein
MKTELRRLSDYEPLTNAVLKLVAKKTAFHTDIPLDQLMSEHPRLIVAFNHASPLSWIPAPCLLTAQLAARGGGSRRPIAVMDRFFYSLPGLKDVAKFITQSDRPLRFEELVQHFEELGTADLVVFPEGSNCFFGDPMSLQPFRSDRFVEISMRTNTPILLCVHRGSERWGLNVPLTENLTTKISELPLPSFVQRFLGNRLKENGGLTVPLPPTPMAQFSMYTKVFYPEVPAVLGGLPKDFTSAEWRKQVANQASNVHQEMRSMLTYLDGLLANSASESRI